MKTYIKFTSRLLAEMRTDLRRPHAFAYERVGFLLAGATLNEDGNILLLNRAYITVADEDYIKDSSAGAVIGSDAIRKGLQAAYKCKSSLIHIHTHGGKGKPEFSLTDINSSNKFVPSFFNAIPQMPHGIVVLSNDSAKGLFWTHPESKPFYIDGFYQVGSHCQKFGGNK